MALVYAHLLDETLPLSGSVNTKGIDGYQLDCDADLFAIQVQIDLALQASRPKLKDWTDWKPDRDRQVVWHSDELRSMLRARRSAMDPVLGLRAISRRLTRLAGRVDEESRLWTHFLNDMATRLLEGKPTLSEAHLMDLLHSVNEVGSEALLPVVTEHITARGYSRPLVDAMKKWQAKTYGSHAAMTLRNRIGWLLWFEDVTEIREECWSDLLRGDLRRCPPEMRAAWRALLENVTFGFGEKPPAKWFKPAARALSAVGNEEFCEKVRRWFAPFRDGTKQRLTVIGRDILRNLMFYGLVAGNPAVDEAISWFATAAGRRRRIRRVSRSFYRRLCM